MHRLRSPGTIGFWAVVLGLLLAVAPLFQTPCSRAAGPQSSVSDAVMTTVTAGAQWTCSKTVSTMRVRAVSPERPAASFGLSLGDGSTAAPSFRGLFGFLAEPPPPPRPSISPTLDALRPVVLQI
jgi:hypothetical protein